MTTSQQTDRRGTDEIPGPRGGQGVRLLVLGADADAQDLRDQARAAGYELAQRYSARVSHVAYGSGVDPEDVRYTKIRDAGLALLPLQKCAEQLGLGADAADATDPVDAVDVADAAEAEPVADVVETVETDAADPNPEPEPDSADEPEAPYQHDDEPLDFPPLHATSAEAPEAADESADEPEPLYDHEVENAFVPGFADEPAEELEVPLAAAVLGIDPWEGESATATASAPESPSATATATAPTPEQPDTRPVAQTPPHSDSDSDSHSDSDSGFGHVLLSVLWALIPLATFGLLTPVTFGYAAYRLRSRRLALTALVYTLAVVVAFVLSAIRPHASTPADTSGALLTVCLAGTWIGGTLHALSLRTRVFVR